MRRGALIAITRAAEESADFEAHLKKIGARTLRLPTIEIRRQKLGRAAERVFRELEDYDWLLFTSRHAVAFFLRELGERRIRFPKRSPRIGAVGKETALALERAHVSIDALPARFTVADLLGTLGNVQGQRILFPRSKVAPHDAAKDLERAGARVTVLPIYTTVRAVISSKLMELFEKSSVDYVTFTSPSSVHGLVANFKGPKGKIACQIPAVCIGPQTGQAARRAGFKKIYMASEFTAAGLLRTLRRLP